MDTGISLLGQVDVDLTELLVYAAIFVVLTIGLVLVKIFLGVYTARKIRNMRTPYGLSGEDLGKLKDRGGLSEEEFKAVRAAMARQILERTREEDEAKKLPPKAAIILSKAEMELREKARNAGDKTPQEEISPSEQEPPPETPAEQPQAKPEPPPIELPEHLRQMVDKPEVELEQLLVAGFITREEYLLIREFQRREDV
ncbi:MAG: SHOCT domain-containing protein [Candidatus Sumerlaeia bacterium]|nr:SHOCT domain-containing protein [Candidatus Sumerlaeia bacterium]